MATKYTHAQTYDKENACEPPHLKTGKISGKEGRMEHSILGVAEEDLEDGRLVEAKRKMKQKGVEGFVLSLNRCLVEGQEVV